jgi:hypothetical protein
MTQESNHRSPASKRAGRTTRNRPVLVTPSTPTDSATEDALVAPSTIEEAPGDTSQLAEETSSAQADTSSSAPTATRKLAGFFSRVGKSTQAETPEADTTQARLARATRGKTATPIAKTTVPAKKSEVRETVKASPPASARSAPARPRSGFKTRYILGLAIYLLGAQLIGAYEATFLNANHLDNVLFKIGSIAISTSTLAFLATLVILLIVLARFDLIPRNLGTLMGQPTASRKTGPAPSRTEESIKTPPPTMKQGVKGADDDLYQEYREQRRYQQRRDRKR